MGVIFCTLGVTFYLEICTSGATQQCCTLCTSTIGASWGFGLYCTTKIGYELRNCVHELMNQQKHQDDTAFDIESGYFPTLRFLRGRAHIYINFIPV